jgi:hypothetical protein
MTAVVAAAFAALLLWRAVSRRAGFATWHMFVGVSQCRMHLRYRDDDGHVQELNPWDYLPHSMTAMNEPLARAFLLYLQRIQQLRVSGSIELRDGHEIRALQVEDGDVVE